MPRWVREVIGALVMAVAAGVMLLGLYLIHPGLSLAATGLLIFGSAVAWLRRGNPFPAVTTEVEERDSLPDEDDDGRMEVRRL